VAVAQAIVVGAVVQHAAVAPGRHDRAIGRRLRTLAPELVEEFGLDLVLEAPRRAGAHRAPVGGRRDAGRAAHGVEFRLVLAQAHLVEDGEQVDRAGGRADAGARLGAYFAEPEPDPGIEGFIRAERVEERPP